MKVLVAVASRHGSTKEIGEAIVEVLVAQKIDAELADPDDVEDVEPYQAVVLGSAVYVGRWAASARAMVDRCAPALVRRPVWLFSSGPLGFPALPASDPDEVAGLMTRLGAREHRSFAGRLDAAALGLAERAVVALVRAEEGDFRAWSEVEDWARQIAAELHQEEIRGIRLVR